MSRPTHRPARRRFLLTTLGVSAAATGLAIGWSLMPPRQRLVPSQPLPAPEVSGRSTAGFASAWTAASR